jgi:hypothetical protein
MTFAAQPRPLSRTGRRLGPQGAPGDRRSRGEYGALLRREFAQVRLVAAFWNGLGVGNDKQGARVFIAAGLSSSWAQAWPAFRNYS